MAGFFSYFLSNFIFPGFPSESISPSVFPLPACLARGEAIVLGPLILGTLFHQLDRAHSDMERSLGRYDMSSMVSTNFLLAFFYEHFPAVAPTPTTFLERGRLQYRIERWSNTSVRLLWIDNCDRKSNFIPCPYSVRIARTVRNDDFLISVHA